MNDRRKKIIRRILIATSGIAGVVLILLCVGAALLCTDGVQQWLLKETTSSLSERLKTRVEADSISVNPFKGTLSLYGFSIDDLSKTEMLRVDTLHVGIGMHHLLERCIEVNDLKLCSTKAVLYKERKDTAANYQFVIDAFKKKPSAAKKHGDGKKKLSLRFDLDDVELHNIVLKWDVKDKKRKNFHKPHHGAFDANHLNATLSMRASLHQVRDDSLRAVVEHLKLYDCDSKLDIRNLTAKCAFSKEYVTISDTEIHLAQSLINLSTISLTLKKENTGSGKLKTRAYFQPFNLNANVVLQDISEPFAPPLEKFTTPLDVSVKVGGTMSHVTFNDIRVSTPDKRLQLTASGDMCNLGKPKEQLSLHFRNIDMKARKGIKEEIVQHFAHQIKMKMQRQMRMIGDIHFKGHLGIFYRREVIGGSLFTKYGNVSTNFVLNSDTKLMTGTLTTDSLNLGKIMAVDHLGPVNLTADFSFDISSRKNRADKHGRLPIGHLSAVINKVSYGVVHVKEINAEVTSNGSVAEGEIHVPMALLTLSTRFSYIQTDTEQELKVHPSVSLGRKHSKLKEDDKGNKRKG